jgi:hypothetical protein
MQKIKISFRNEPTTSIYSPKVLNEAQTFYYYMLSSADKITLLPAFLLFALSAYLAFLNLQVTVYSTKTALLNCSTVLFIGGTLLIAAWIPIWIIRVCNEKT